MALLGSIADLGAGIFKRWFSKEAKEEGRDNEISRLGKEQKELAKNNSGGKYNKRLSYISERLSILQQEAQNTR